MSEIENSAFCPYCSEKIIIPHNEKFEFGRPIKCEQCLQKFNIFRIYEKIYNDIEMGKKIANMATQIIYSDYDIEGSSEYDVPKLKDYMFTNFGKETFQEIILKSVVYGMCILHCVKNDNDILFKPLYLPQYEIITEVGTKGGQAFYELIKEVRNFETDIVIPRKDIAVLYVESSISNDEIGFSLYGMWFRIWAILNIAPQSISYSKLRGKIPQSQNLAEIQEYYNNQMLSTLSVIKMTGGASERETLASRIENEIFPVILGKKSPLFSEVVSHDHQYPTMIFTKDRK